MFSDDINSDPVVLVGGGFAGLTTALSLSRHQDRPKIVLIEPRAKFVFVPLLYELLSGEMNSWEIAPSYNSLIEDRGIVLIKDKVKSIKTSKMQVITESGLELNYSKVLICTGAKPNDYGIKGVAEHALKFHCLRDVELLRELINDLRGNIKALPNSLVIVGGGFSGIELACKLSDLLEQTIDIHLIESGDRLLPQGKSFNQEQSEKALIHRGIRIHLRTEVLEITADTVHLRTSDDMKSHDFVLQHRGLIWTAGSKAVFPEIIPSPSLKNGKISIDSSLNLIGYKNIMAAGDVCSVQGMICPATAQVAIKQGELVARNLINSMKGIDPKVFEFNDQGEMLSLGIGEASITALGLTISGPLGFQIRRITYLVKMLDKSLGIRSASSWLLGFKKKCFLWE